MLEPEEQTAGDEPETVDDIAAALDPESPIQGPILEPQEIAVYEHEHYQEIRERNEAVRILDEQHDRAKAAAKRAKDALDDAQAELSEFISRGPSIPGRKYAKKVRLVKEVQADTDLGKNFVTLPMGECFDVHDIEGDNVAVLVTGVVNFLELGEFEVIEWSEKAPKPEALPKVAKRIKLLIDFKSEDSGVQFDAGTEHVCQEQEAGAVSIKLLDKEVFLKAGEYEVIEWGTPIDPNGWRLVSLADVFTAGQAKKAIKLLDAEKIATLGQFIDWQAERNEFRNLPGVGPEMEGAVGDACAEFFKAHPEYAQNAAE